MSTYTIQIRNLVENGYTIFDFDYPIFDESYRKVLEQKIIDRYYFREIGLETPAQFKHFLKMRLNEIMPYYNQLYESESLVFDPMTNVDVTETQTRETQMESSSSTSGTGSSESESTSKNVFQDTPQSRLGDVNYATNINDDSNQLKGQSENTSSGEGQSNSMETYEMRRFGTEGMRYPASVLMEWRQSFLNIDVQILDDLNDLFMGVY